MFSWMTSGFFVGLGMVLVGTGFANGLELNSDIVRANAALGAVLLAVSASAYITSRSKRLKALGLGTPVALILIAALGQTTERPVAKPVLGLSHVSTALERKRDGHFRAEAEINGGHTVELLVDTGASVVLLSYEHARAVGLDMRALEFNVPVITASGRSSVALLELASIDIGGVSLAGIEAAVAMPGELKTSLLGMSYLGELDEVVLRGNEMILKN